MTAHWGSISATEWPTVPCTVGRTATHADVEAGTAVFFVQGESEPAPIALPCCAIQSFEDGSQQRVVVVQAELGPHGIILGVRPLSGGNAVCMATEVELLPAGFGSGD
jgi:hypothetical protein